MQKVDSKIMRVAGGRHGRKVRRAFMSFVEAQDKELAAWMEENVTFPNSMVDRITPATRPEDIKRLNEENGTDDKARHCGDKKRKGAQEQLLPHA